MTRVPTKKILTHHPTTHIHIYICQTRARVKKGHSEHLMGVLGKLLSQYGNQFRIWVSLFAAVLMEREQKDPQGSELLTKEYSKVMQAYF